MSGDIFSLCYIFANMEAIAMYCVIRMATQPVLRVNMQRLYTLLLISYGKKRNLNSGNSD